MHPRLHAPSPTTTRQPDWDPASWLPFLPALERGDDSALDIPALLDAGLLVPTFHGTVVPLPLLLNGVVLTHRLTPGEVAGGFLDLDPDLAPLCEPAQAGIPLAGGGEARQATIREAAELGLDRHRVVLTGRPGWLAGFAPDDALAVSLLDGVLVIERVTAPAPRRADARALRRMFRTMVDRLTTTAAAAVTVRELVREVLLVDADRWSDVEAPLGEQLGAAGLRTEHGWVALPGVDLSGYRPQPLAPLPLGELLATLPEAPDRAELEELHRALFRHRVGILDDDPARRGELAALLGRPGMVTALLAWSGSHEGFDELLAALLPHARGRARSAGHVLRACAAGRRERPDDVVAHIERAMEDDPCPEALTHAAALAEIAGDVDEALALHRRAGEYADHEALARLERLEGGDHSPLAERAPWLWEKARTFVVSTFDTGAWADLATVVPAGMDLTHGLFAGFFTECVLFDLGGLGRFLAWHGERLPADERALAESWLGTPWRLWRIEDVGPDDAATVTDVVADKRHRVRLGPDERHLGPGLLLLGRVLPAGDGAWLAYGALPLDDSEQTAAEHTVRMGINGIALVRLLDGGP